MSPSSTAALPLARSVLRLLLVLNGLYAVGILALLLAQSGATTWTMTALGVPPAPDTAALVTGMRAITALGLVPVPLNYVIFKGLLAIVDTVRAGDPFVAVNAGRLRAIAWALLGLQLLSIVIGTIAEAVSTPQHPLHLDSGFSISGWLAVLLIFVLAQVFAKGALMREDLEGTV